MLAARVGPILSFVVCLTVVAELSSALGVFALLARVAARLARGSVLALWLLVVLVGVAATAVLSLDTTAVLLTPLVLALAAQLDLDRELFALTAVWLANTASLLLPVSNLTNLLAVGRLPAGGASGFAALSWAPALACVLVTVAGLACWQLVPATVVCALLVLPSCWASTSSWRRPSRPGCWSWRARLPAWGCSGGGCCPGRWSWACPCCSSSSRWRTTTGSPSC